MQSVSHADRPPCGRRLTCSLPHDLAICVIHGKIDAGAFLDGITTIPGDIPFVKVDQLTVDVTGDHGVVTGIQQAQLKIDGSAEIDRRAFVDWFVREAGSWQLRLAVDLPTAES